jgi:hypothetical protein
MVSRGLAMELEADVVKVVDALACSRESSCWSSIGRCEGWVRRKSSGVGRRWFDAWGILP